MKINNLAPKTINTSPKKVVPQEEKNSFEYFAAVVIQKYYRGYSVRQNNNYRYPFKVLGADINLRKVFFNYMEKLNAQINFSPSAAIFNGLKENEIEVKLKGKNFRENEENTKDELINCINTRIANCKELAMILFCLLENAPEITQLVKSSLKLITLAPPNNHAFVMYDNLVLDPWIKYLRLSPNYHNPSPIFIEPENKTRGFVGTYEQYVNFTAKYPEESEHMVLQQVQVDLIKDFCFIYRKEVYDHFMKTF